jgi:hypothetical protein
MTAAVRTAPLKVEIFRIPASLSSSKQDRKDCIGAGLSESVAFE